MVVARALTAYRNHLGKRPSSTKSSCTELQFDLYWRIAWRKALSRECRFVIVATPLHIRAFLPWALNLPEQQVLTVAARCRRQRIQCICNLHNSQLHASCASSDSSYPRSRLAAESAAHPGTNGTLEEAAMRLRDLECDPKKVFSNHKHDADFNLSRGCFPIFYPLFTDLFKNYMVFNKY